jgi:AraC-like DNA-binding protein
MSTIRDRVRSAIEHELGDGDPTSDRIAARLNLHPKTLSRRLAAVGTNYRAVRDELRFELAARYLSQPRLRVDDIALLLGYSEASAFDRAFRRWSGCTPSAYRRSQQAA